MNSINDNTQAQLLIRKVIMVGKWLENISKLTVLKSPLFFFEFSPRQMKSAFGQEGRVQRQHLQFL